MASRFKGLVSWSQHDGLQEAALERVRYFQAGPERGDKNPWFCRCVSLLCE